MALNDKLAYLIETKNQLKTLINNNGGNLTDTDSFRSYVTAIEKIFNEAIKGDPLTTLLMHFNENLKDESIYNFGSEKKGCTFSTEIKKFGTASLNIGNGNYLLLSNRENTPIISARGFTIEFWLYLPANPPNDTSYRGVVSFGCSTVSYCSFIGFYNGTFGAFNGTQWNVTTPITDLPVASWFNVCFSYYPFNNRAYLFIDGVLKNQKNIQSAVGLYPCGQFVLGATSGGYGSESRGPSVCYIDELRIRNSTSGRTSSFTPANEPFTF